MLALSKIYSRPLTEPLRPNTFRPKQTVRRTNSCRRRSSRSRPYRLPDPAVHAAVVRAPLEDRRGHSTPISPCQPVQRRSTPASRCRDHRGGHRRRVGCYSRRCQRARQASPRSWAVGDLRALGEHDRGQCRAVDSEQRPRHERQDPHLRRDRPVARRRRTGTGTWPTSPSASPTCADYVDQEPVLRRLIGRYGNRIAKGSSRWTARLPAADQQRPEQPARRHERLRQARLGRHAVQARRRASALRLELHQPGRRPGLPRHAQRAGHLHADQARHGSGSTTRPPPTSRRSST